MADMTMEDLQTMLANRDNAVADAITAYAMRPQKSSVITNTNTTTTPYALDDMLARREKIGLATRALDEALKEREGFGYNMANALAGIPQQQGYGTWLGDFARAFGAGFSGATNARTDRALKRYNNEMKDLETILKFDKEMGSSQNSNQTQTMKYDEMPWGTSVKNKNDNKQDSKTDIALKESAAANLADIYKTIEDNPTAFSSVGGIKQDEATRALRDGIETAGITDLQHREFEYLRNMMPNGFATTINAAAEQKFMAPYTTAYKNGTGSAKKAQIKNMLGAIYDAYKVDAASQGFAMPISKEEYIKSRLDAGRAYNKDFYIKSNAPMYKDNTESTSQPTNEELMKKFTEGLI